MRVTHRHCDRPVSCHFLHGANVHASHNQPADNTCAQGVKYNVLTQSRKFFRSFKRLAPLLRPEHQPVRRVPRRVLPLPQYRLQPLGHRIASRVEDHGIWLCGSWRYRGEEEARKTYFWRNEPILGGKAGDVSRRDAPRGNSARTRFLITRDIF